MGRVAEVKSFERLDDEDGKGSQIIADPGDGNAVTAEHYQAAGDDAPPLPGDYVALQGAQGEEVAIGYADPINAGTAAPGERRLYSRDSNGAVVAQLSLMADGKIVLTTPGARIGAAGASEAMALGTTLASKLQEILDYLSSIDAVLKGAPIAQPGTAPPSSSALQAALAAAVASTALPSDLNGITSTKHKIDE